MKRYMVQCNLFNLGEWHNFKDFKTLTYATEYAEVAKTLYPDKVRIVDTQNGTVVEQNRLGKFLAKVG